jgi:hypothetical protein
MVLPIRSVAAPVVGVARNTWDLAVDKALRMESEYSWWVDSFQNDAGTLTDRQMFSAAYSAAAAQTTPPMLKFGPREYDLSASATTGYNPFPGFAFCGSEYSGLSTIEQGSAGSKTRILANTGDGTQSFIYANTGGDVYSPLTCHNIAFRSTNGVSQWLHAPISTTNMYGMTLGNLEFTGFYRCIGQPNNAATVTLFTMWGAWNIPNMAGTPISIRGSDNWLVPDECNIGWNAGPAGEYLVRLENVQKTWLRGFYLTCRLGGTRALLVDNGASATQGGLFVSDCVIEGQNLSEPAAGALIVVNANGVVSLDRIALNFAKMNATQLPSDTAYIMATLGTHGLLNVHDVTVTRASGQSQNIPIIAQTGGGKVSAGRIFGQPGNGAANGQLWTDLPVVTSSAGYMEIDNTLRMG